MTKEEFWAQVNQARKHSNRMLRRLRIRGNEISRSRQQLIEKYLRSFDVALVAIADVYGSKKSRPSYDELTEIARNLSVYQPCSETVYYSRKPKGDGTFRPIFDFGPINKARQIIVKRCVEALYQPRPFMYGVKGSDPAFILDAVREAHEAGSKWAVVGDVRQCFQSYEPEKLYEALPLPRRVIDNVILSRGYTHAIRMRGQYSLLRSPRGFAEIQLGIATGSAASSIVSNFLVEAIIQPFVANGVGLCVYADDVLIFSGTRREAASITAAVRTSFEQSLAGSLRWEAYRPRKLYDGVRYVGRFYRRSRRAGARQQQRMMAYVPPSKLAEHEKHFERMLRRSSSLAESDLQKLWQRLNGVYGAYRETANINQWYWQMRSILRIIEDDMRWTAAQAA